MAVVTEGNSLEFALQETGKGFSLSGKSVNLKPELVYGGRELPIEKIGFLRNKFFFFFIFFHFDL